MRVPPAHLSPGGPALGGLGSGRRERQPSQGWGSETQPQAPRGRSRESRLLVVSGRAMSPDGSAGRGPAVGFGQTERETLYLGNVVQ